MTKAKTQAPAKGQKAKTAKAKSASKKKPLLFTLDCTQPVEDKIMKVDDFEQFLKNRIKVEGKTSNLGDSVVVSSSKNTLKVETKIPFSKRYLKYLSKKYLKKNNLRDWLRVVATSPTAYELRYFQINQDSEEEEDHE
uniref:Large ribosomal subunit protein eL22 n=1 Tax=Pectinaria gouldii TaxID=260746 RepID=B6VAI7_PECGU|nr:ribosomal-like protein [Pectinaria gouldii]